MTTTETESTTTPEPLLTLTYDEALSALEDAVKLNGENFIYKAPAGRCAYFGPDGAPSCIVGHVLAAKGVTADQAEEGSSYGCWNSGTSVSELVESGVIALLDDGATEVLLANAQTNQDAGRCWSYSVESGKKAAETYRSR